MPPKPKRKSRKPKPQGQAQRSALAAATATATPPEAVTGFSVRPKPPAPSSPAPTRDAAPELDPEPEPEFEPELDPEPEPEPEPEWEPKPAALSLVPTGSQPYVKTPHETSKKDAAAVADIPFGKRRYDFFINHCQRTGADQCACLGRLLQARGFSVWRDMEADDLTEHGMEQGVAKSRVVLMFL